MEPSQVGLLLAKIETTYGTDPTPTAAANIIAVARGLVAPDAPSESIDRDILDGGFGRVIGINARPHWNFKFRVELRGNRTDGVAADVSAGSASNKVEIDPLLQACDLAPAYTAESSGGARDGHVIYNPTVPVNEGSSLTIYFYSQGKLYKATGCKGNIENIVLEAGKFGFLDFSFMGRYNAPSDSSIPGSQTWLTTQPPTLEMPQTHVAAVVTVDSTTDTITHTGHALLNGDRVRFAAAVIPGGLTAGVWYFVRDKATNTYKVAATLGGAAINITSNGTTVTVDSAPALVYDDWPGAVFSTMNLRLGNSTVMREDGNSTDGVIGFVNAGRDSKGDFDPESIKEVTHPLWADWKSAKAKTLLAQIGNLTGNRITLTAKTKIEKLVYSDRNGRRIQTAQFGVRNAALGETPGSELALRFH